MAKKHKRHHVKHKGRHVKHKGRSVKHKVVRHHRKKSPEEKAAWMLLAGIIISIILGIVSSQLTANQTGNMIKSIILIVIVIIGILIGVLNFNVRAENASRFLLASLIILVVSYMGVSVVSLLGTGFLIGPVTRGILDALLIMFIPATIIVSLKYVFELTKKKR